MKIFFLLLFFGGVSYLSAKIINVPDDYALIQDAIDNAQTTDTVLIAPGIYKQPFTLDKDITIGSLFLTTGERYYISNTTILDSLGTNQFIHMSKGCLSGLNLGEFKNSNNDHSLFFTDTNVISDIKIKNNIINARYILSFIEFSAFQLNNVILTNNKVLYKGELNDSLMGTCIFNNSEIFLNNIVIKNNDASVLDLQNHSGYDARLSNISILNNSGAALSCYATNFYAENLIILKSGSIDITGVDSISIKNSRIAYNCTGVNINGDNLISPQTVFNIEGTSINNNEGTGLNIYMGIKEINLSTQNLNSIYKNKSIINDLKEWDIKEDSYYDKSLINDIKTWNFDAIAQGVVLDTFTTEQNTFIYTCSPVIKGYEMTLRTIPVTANHYISTQVNADLYVSPDGSDDNSGLSMNQPFKTISHALDVIYADSLDPKTIHLAPGIYSESTNNEKFPLRPVYGVSIIGSDPQNTILDGEGNSMVLDISNLFLLVFIRGYPPSIINIFPDQKLLLSNLKITGGLGEGWIQSDYSYDGAVTIGNGSNVRFEKCIIAANNDFGVGINFSFPPFINCTMIDDIGLYGSHSYLINCIVCKYYNNICYYCYPEIIYSITDVDPDTIFTDPGNGNYTLLEGSAAIDAGTAYYATYSRVLIDLDSTQYIGEAPDLGAIESSFVIDINSQEEQPQTYSLSHNYPNPFNPITNIKYQIPYNEYVDISIYNILGQKVVTLVNKKQLSGTYEVQWDASEFSSGIYFYTLKTNTGFVNTKKLLLLK